MTKRRPFSQREHLGAGALISSVERDLAAVGMAIQDAYGPAAGEPLFRIVDRISRFKSTLDDRVCWTLKADQSPGWHRQPRRPGVMSENQSARACAAKKAIHSDIDTTAIWPLLAGTGLSSNLAGCISKVFSPGHCGVPPTSSF
jgi:hypothetical protein